MARVSASWCATMGTGTGLRNTRERLSQLYGDRGLVSIADAPGGGTVVTVDIPIPPDGNGNGSGNGDRRSIGFDDGYGD